MINKTYSVLSLIHNPFILRLLVWRKLSLFVVAFTECINQTPKSGSAQPRSWQPSWRSVQLFLKQSQLLLLAPPNRIRLALAPQYLRPGLPKGKRRKDLHVPERLVSGGAKSEILSYNPRGCSSKGTSLCQIWTAVCLNVVTACRLWLSTACLKWGFQSSLQRINIICILHTWNKNIWEGDIL